jgi:hypothetical protein
MNDFCYSIDDENDRAELLDAIHGNGAFRMFRKTTERLGILESWYQYRKNALEKIARQWLDSHNLPYK